jgi:hypothetical protein
MNSKIQPNCKFIKDNDKKPGLVGIELTDNEGPNKCRAWYSKKYVEKHIKISQYELDFFKEILEQFNE